VHLSIFILVINQLDAQNLFYNKFHFTRLHVSSTIVLIISGQNCIIQPLVSSHSVGGRPVHRTATYRVWWYQRLYNTILATDDEHNGAW